MLKHSLVLLAFLNPVSAQAAGIGLICDGKSVLVLAPQMVDAEMCAAKYSGQCTAGFTSEGGFYALAATADGAGSGLAAGYGAQDRAELKALKDCAALGGGDCTLTQSGLDDGQSWLNCKAGM